MEKAGIRLISTTRLDLKPISIEDSEKIVEWRNNDCIIEHLFSSEKVTLDQHLRWFEKYKNLNDRIEFIINIKGENLKIGTIGLSSIDKSNNKAEYGIMLGEKAYEGKGYANEATIAIINYSFNVLNLNKVYLKVFSDNERAIRLYNKIGFIQEGTLRQEVFKNGLYRDVITMSILSAEWKDIK